MSVFDEPWTAEELAEVEACRVRTGVQVMATAMKIEGFPTIHELAKMGTTNHQGFGYFETVGPGWKMEWCGGGAMHRTSTGKAYTPVFIEGVVEAFEEKAGEARIT